MQMGIIKSLTLTSSRPPDESEIVKFGNMVFHDGRAISQFATKIVVISGLDSDKGAIFNLIQGYDLE